MSNKRPEEWRVVEWGGVGRGERSESARQEVLSSVGAPPRHPGRESFTRGPGLDVASASSGQSHVPAFPGSTRPTSQFRRKPNQSGVMFGQENIL